MATPTPSQSSSSSSGTEKRMGEEEEDEEAEDEDEEAPVVRARMAAATAARDDTADDDDDDGDESSRAAATSPRIAAAFVVCAAAVGARCSSGATVNTAITASAHAASAIAAIVLCALDQHTAAPDADRDNAADVVAAPGPKAALIRAADGPADGEPARLRVDVHQSVVSCGVAKTNELPPSDHRSRRAAEVCAPAPGAIRLATPD
jgi:hypothetical protein